MIHNPDPITLDLLQRVYWPILQIGGTQAAEMAAFSQSQEWNTQNEGVPYHTEHLNVTPPDKAREEIHQIIQDITQEEPYERVTDR